MYDQEMRRNVRFADMRREETGQVVRYLRPAPGMSTVLYSRLNAQNADAVIAAEMAYFAQQKLLMEWKVFSHDQPADLAERLLAHGFCADDCGAIMALDLEEMPASLLQPVTLDVRRLEQPGQLEDVITVMQQVWGGNFDWLYERLGSHMQVPGYLSVYVAYVDNLPASAGWTYFYPGSPFAGIWGGSTIAPQRAKGLYTALLATRAQEARLRGYRFLTIDASPMSQPIVERHGFITLAQACSYNWNA